MNRHRRSMSLRRWERVLAVALAGGLLPASCQTRFRDVVVEGTKNYVSILLDPSRYFDDLFASPTEP